MEGTSAHGTKVFRKRFIPYRLGIIPNAITVSILTSIKIPQIMPEGLERQHIKLTKTCTDA